MQINRRALVQTETEADEPRSLARGRARGGPQGVAFSGRGRILVLALLQRLRLKFLGAGKLIGLDEHSGES